MYFLGGHVRSLRQVPWASRPRLTRRDRALNFVGHGAFRLPNGRHDLFAVRSSGYIHAPRTGTYTFKTRSDDGSKVYINGRLVVNNGGLHAPRDRSGSVHLRAGYHRVRVDMFEKHGTKRE